MIPPSQHIFRKVALDRLSSPEQLDQVMRVTRPGGWIALAAIGALLLTGLVWGTVGTLSDRVSGQGILVKSGGVLEVVATTPGRVTDVPVSAGDQVTAGQVVAWAAQPELLERLEQARGARDAVAREHAQLLAFTRRDRVLQNQTLERGRANLRQSIAAGEAAAASLAERLASQEELVRQGLLARPTLLATRQQYDAARESVRGAQAQLVQLDAQELTVSNRHGESLQGGERRLAEARAQVAQLEREFERSSRIVSPYSGRVLEVITEQGKLIAPGEAVLRLDLTGRAVTDLMAVIYVPSLYGKMVKPGMAIQIAPSTVRPEEYGMMLGRVVFVSDYPATPRGMNRALKNDQLVALLSGDGAPYEVHAELVVDPSTRSQYRWSSSAGPPTEIQSGTMARGMVTVSSERPLAKVIPLLRRWAGV